MSKNYVAVLRQTRSVKGQTIPEGTEMGTVAIDAVKGFEARNIESLIEQGFIELVSPEEKKKPAPAKDEK